jgi:hypothetical protein
LNEELYSLQNILSYLRKVFLGVENGEMNKNGKGSSAEHLNDKVIKLMAAHAARTTSPCKECTSMILSP